MATAATKNGTFSITLSGFSHELNWRPTEFTSAIPQDRCCSLCCVIPNKSRVLVCSHVFCETCYDRMVKSSSVCPLDNTPFTKSQANTVDFSQLQLLTREVHCWNRSNGCTFVGRLLDALAHFHETCDYHIVTCSKCKGTVVQRDILDHQKRQCTGCRASLEDNHFGASTRRPSPAVPHPRVNDILETTKKIETLMNHLADNQASIQDSLNNFTATSQESLHDVASSIANQASQITELCQKQEMFNSASKTTMTNIEISLEGLPALLHNQCRLRNVAPQTFHLSADKVCWPVENIMGRMENENAPKILSEPFILGGYRARLTVKFDRTEPDVQISSYFSLRPGSNDDGLDWPFVIPVKMSLAHPTDRKKEKRRLIDPVASNFPEIFQRPSQDVDHGEGGSLVKRSEMDEYVTEGSILLCVELLRDRDLYAAQYMEVVVDAFAEMLS